MSAQYRPPKQTRVVYRDALAELVEALDRMYGRLYLSENVRRAKATADEILARERIDTRDPDDASTEPGRVSS